MIKRPRSFVLLSMTSPEPGKVREQHMFLITETFIN